MEIRPLITHTIEHYNRKKPGPFSPKGPEHPKGEEGQWILRGTTSLEAGLVMCHWEFSEALTSGEKIRNAQGTLAAVYDALRQLHPDESKHPKENLVVGRIARTLVKLGTHDERTLPPHLHRYVKDLLEKT